MSGSEQYLEIEQKYKKAKENSIRSKTIFEELKKNREEISSKAEADVGTSDLDSLRSIIRDKNERNKIRLENMEIILNESEQGINALQTENADIENIIKNSVSVMTESVKKLDSLKG